MSARKVQFINDHWYHICNRGVEKRNIFLDDEDFLRFIYHLFECNDVNLLPNESFQKRKKIGSHRSDNKNKKLVDIGGWCLMPNHFHLLVKQCVKNGVRLFIQRSTLAYAKGFNNKYERVGPLFQGPFVARLIDKDEYFRYIVAYILANPLDISEPYWKENGIKNLKKAISFLKNYKYSGLQELTGKFSFPLLINQKELQKIVGNIKDIEKLTADLLKCGFNKVNHLLLD